MLSKSKAAKCHYESELSVTSMYYVQWNQ